MCSVGSNKYFEVQYFKVLLTIPWWLETKEAVVKLELYDGESKSSFDFLGGDKVAYN